MSKIEKMSLYVDRAARVFLVILMSVMVMDVLFGVSNRFIFKLTISWTEEVARYLMIWICLIGSTIALREGTHVAVNFFVMKCSEKTRKKVFFLNQILIFAFLVIPSAYGIQLCISQMKQISPATRISMFWPYLSVPTGCIIMMLHLIFLNYQLRKKSSDNMTTSI
jgi:TRAP-type C4-dicarboxylate transport system permease small subunit